MDLEEWLYIPQISECFFGGDFGQDSLTFHHLLNVLKGEFPSHVKTGRQDTGATAEFGLAAASRKADADAEADADSALEVLEEA